MDNNKHNGVKRNFIILFLCLSSLLNTIAASFHNSPLNNSNSGSPWDDLAKVLGIKRVPLHLRNRSPPEYFKHLFRSTTEEDGTLRRPTPFHADTITGFLDGAGIHQRYFRYNISTLNSDNDLLGAEFHLYRMRTRRSRRYKRSAQLINLKLYRVTSPTRRNTTHGNRLIDVKRVIANQAGWVVFNLQEAVQDWLEQGGQNNYGLIVSARNMNDNSPVPFIEATFAQRFQHHDRLQPNVVLYTKKQTSLIPFSDVETPMTEAFLRNDPNRFYNIYHRRYYLRPSTYNTLLRRRRSVSNNQSASSSSSQSSSTNSNTSPNSNTRRRTRSFRRQLCSLSHMEVDFGRMGWDKWIITPQVFDARICSGSCPFPLGQAFHPTNHAVVQSIWHHLTPRQQRGRFPRPCCVPHAMNALNMLYYDEENKVILKQYNDMVVTSCGCK